MERRGPLAASYPGAAALVIFSLIPYLVLSAGIFPLIEVIGKSLAISSATLEVTIAASTGAYAVGTVLAVQFAVHLPARRMLVVYEASFVIASVLAASATDANVFIGAFIAQGLCTSLMLIGAVPPLVTRWPAKKMPMTGLIMNLCIFGAVALGPTLGALQLDGKNWRPLFWGVAGVACLALVFSLLTFEDDPPADTSQRWDVGAVTLAVLGCGAAFFGAGQLQATMKVDATSLGPLVGGTVLIIALVLFEYHLPSPLIPVRSVTTTLPVTGILVALAASASGFGVMELMLEALKTASSPLHTALLFLPEFVGAMLAAGSFGLLFRTRYTPLLALSGLLSITAASALFLSVVPSTGPAIAVCAALLGLGVGASVSPALFVVGFSLRSPLLQRVFALIELLRGVTAFLLAPILVFLVTALGPTPVLGIKSATWICLGIAAGGALAGSCLYLFGGRGFQAPDLERWQQGDAPAWESPRLLERVRRVLAWEKHEGEPRPRDRRPEAA